MLERDDIVRIPFPGGQSVPLDTNERTTLGSFRGIAIEVSSGEALPLQVYLMSGNSKRLGIHPRNGQIEMGATRLKLNDGGGHELLIFRDPLKE